MAWNGEERRKHKRYGVRGSTIRYKRGGLLAFMTSSSERYLVLNMSEGGLHFISKEELREGQRVSLTLDAPGLEGIVRGRGVVVWARKSHEHQAWRVGVRFTRFDERSRFRLRHILDNAILERVDITTKIYLKEIEKL